MRYLSIVLCTLAVAAYAAPAVALNPQPLPPGIYSYEPPDPCVKVHERRAHARCIARYNSSFHNQPSVGSQTGGAGAGK